MMEIVEGIGSDVQIMYSAAPQMDHDQIQILIAFADRSRITNGLGAAVEHMAEAATADVLHAGDLGNRVQGAGGHSIVDISGNVMLVCNGPCQQPTQIGCVRLAVCVIHQSLAELVIDHIAPGIQTEHQTASAHYGRQILCLHLILRHKVPDQGEAKGNLIADPFKGKAWICEYHF